MVKFGDIAQNVAVRVDPADAKTDVYVGLEHLDPSTIHLRQWGHPSDVTGQKLAFKKGDVIFGRRRAYQRKLAIAEFDGICSAHAMVVRAKPKMILPEFLPFFLQSDMFMERAIEISVGSLSPTINWKTLREQVFPLPPLDEQKRIAEILWAADEVVESIMTANRNMAVVKEYAFKDFLLGGSSKQPRKSTNTGFGAIPEHWHIKPLSEIADVAYGISASVASNTDPSIGWPILTGANITLDGKFDLTKIVYIEAPKKDAFILRKGDILFNWRSGSPEHVGKTTMFDLDGQWTYASFILRIRPHEFINRHYLLSLLSYMRKTRLFSGATSQQVNFKMNASMLRDLAVVVPPKDEQDYIASRANLLDQKELELLSFLDAQQNLKRQLCNELLGAAHV
ncbi:MAG TPA: restriction endonuclease subunit S [Anaerolineaceae bacterium]|nr:restriction endonuclease subunit S [Anaerolineaceae bacterium]